MIKVKKSWVLILVLIIVLTVFTGCQKEVPEGFGSEFYNDIVATIKETMKEIPNIKKEDVARSVVIAPQPYSDFCDEYYDKAENGELTITEEKTFDALSGLIFDINTDLILYYEDGYDIPSDRTLEKIEELENLLEINIEYKFK